MLVDGLFGEVRFYDMHFTEVPATLAFLAQTVLRVMVAEVPLRKFGGGLLEMLIVGCAFCVEVPGVGGSLFLEVEIGGNGGIMLQKVVVLVPMPEFGLKVVFGKSWSVGLVGVGSHFYDFSKAINFIQNYY